MGPPPVGRADAPRTTHPLWLSYALLAPGWCHPQDAFPLPMMPYRESHGSGLHCGRCGVSTPLPPGAPPRSSDEPFVCATCLVQLQVDASRGREEWDRARFHPPPAPSRSGRRFDPVGIAALATVLAALHHPLLFVGGLVGVGFVYRLVSVKGEVNAGPESSRVLRGALVVLALLAAWTVFVRLTLRSDQAGEEALGAAASQAAPPGSSELSSDPERRAIEVARERGEAAARADRAQAFSTYAHGLAAGTPTLPTSLAAPWKGADGSVISPFSAAIWGVDGDLADTTVLLEKERLRLGGSALRDGTKVVCAGVVEPVPNEAAVFVSACEGAPGSATYRVTRVVLPRLPGALASSPPSAFPLVPPALRGRFKSDAGDCKAAKGKVTVTASAVLEDGGISLVAATSISTRFGLSLSGIDRADGRLCSAAVDTVEGKPQLTTSCRGRTRFLLCK